MRSPANSTSGTSGIRMLVIMGKAGRGKSLYARRLRDELVAALPNSVHFWLNCNYHAPERSSFYELFRQHPDFPAADAASGGALTETALLDALDRLDNNVYLYLDDMDRGDLNLTSRFSYLSALLTTWAGRSRSRLRLIATAKDKEFLGSLHRILGAHFPILPLELMPLNDEQARRFWEQAGVAASLPEPELQSVLLLCHGEPLVMTLLLEQWRKQGAPEAQLSYLRSIIAKGRELLRHGASPEDALRKEIFQARLDTIRQYGTHGTGGIGVTGAHAEEEEVVHNADYRVLTALAVLTPEYGSESVLTDELILQLANRVQSRLPPIEEPHLEAALRYLANAEILTGKMYRADAERNFFYEELQAKETRLLKELHRSAAEYLEQHDSPDYAAWHYSKAGMVHEALRQLENAAPELAANYAWGSLKRLYEELRRSIAALLREHKTLLHNKEMALLLDLSAINEANYAEMLYQNEDFEWERRCNEIIAAVSRGLQGRRHASVEADIHVRALRTIVDFDFGEKSWETLCADTRPLIEQAQALHSPTLEANLRSNLGVYYNRGFQTRDALQEYDVALRLLEPLRRCWEAGSNQSERLEQDILRITVNRSRSLFLSDPPQGGPARAIEALTAEIRKVDEDYEALRLFVPGITTEIPDILRDRRRFMEYTYGAANLCYYNLCQNRIEEADLWLRKCFLDSPYDGSPAETLIKEPWIIACLHALRGAFQLYRDKQYAQAQQQFEACKAEFEAMEMPRDVGFMTVNGVAAQACAWLESAGSLRPEQVAQLCASLDTVEARVLEEPIAGHVVAYLRWRLAPPDDADRPQIDASVRQWVENHFGPLMDNAGASDARRQKRPQKRPSWVPPIILRGALVLRAKPLAPLYPPATQGR